MDQLLLADTVPVNRENIGVFPVCLNVGNRASEARAEHNEICITNWRKCGLTSCSDNHKFAFDTNFSPTEAGHLGSPPRVYILNVIPRDILAQFKLCEKISDTRGVNRSCGYFADFTRGVPRPNVNDHLFALRVATSSNVGSFEPCGNKNIYIMDYNCGLVTWIAWFPN